MATLEKSSAPERSFAQEASRRIILRLAGVDKFPLEHTGALKLHRLLHGEKKKSDYHVLFTGGKYYVEFDGQTGDYETPLAHAVAETDIALDKGSLLAEVDAAWELPAEAPSIDRLTPETIEHMPTVTDAARNMFLEHHSQLLEANLTRMLYDVA